MLVHEEREAWEPWGRALSASKAKVKIPTGKMDECLTFSQCETYLAQVAEKYPELVEKRVVGTSIEGNPLTALCFGKACFDAQKNVPESFINAMHHSRECLSMMAVLYTIDSILEAYELGHAWVAQLIETRKIIFLPIVNPDGYLWNEEKHPLGYGMQRKNRRKGECNYDPEIGVDLNRNYPLCFDRHDDGASSSPCAEDYKGKAPFSEPETQAVKRLVEASNFTVALNIHSYGGLILVPYSCRAMGLPPDQDESFFMKYAGELADANHFLVGRPYDRTIKLYSVNGDAADWMYNAHHIFAISPEVRGGDFWLKGENSGKVVPLSTENIPMILHSVWASGPLVRAREIVLDFSQGDSLQVVVENAGIWNSIGKVRVAARVVSRSDSAELGPLLAKYDSKVADLSSVAKEMCEVQEKKIVSCKAMEFAVYDDWSCAIYPLSEEQLNSLKGKLVNEPIKLEMENTVFHARYAPTAEPCNFWKREEAVTAAPPTSPPTLPTATGMEKITDSMYAHPFAVTLAIVGLMLGACLTCFFHKNTSTYSPVGRSRGDEDEGRQLELEPI